MATLYEIAARIGEECLDGRSNHGAWGLENQFHPTRESADRAVERLRDGGHFGCAEAPSYEVIERGRDDYPDDDIGEQEWRHAARQAGVSPAGAED